VVFGPVFGKKDVPEMGVAGLDLLRSVCRSKIPVFAVGGVTAENAAKCADAGAKGVAGIRLFQESSVAAIIAKLRG
jgi:thiamine-phosphate pyrophosphorylase